ncbi:G-type lectin S-receptor-like serine/threonine-protein kinase At4g27290 isoform X2 [Camellia sinensis]|uniref:G-type lectin S-receptor-like serine/threonine-protein kinase At4g27290 isoform X2 n=1 Tax=Camellia sinensis TaxID=4442 RepID=UPI00103698E6|nr:G-type lectin S-receptor-like serine/threonine-protein kinase At4g27290 isoform X2 [Camellia sinensis]
MDSITNLLLSSFLCSILVVSTTAVNRISTTQSIKDGDTIVSIGGSFALGFFSPGSSKKRYIGIWYNKISNDSRTVVWVANRETPVTDSSGVLMVTQQGVLVLLNSTESIILSSNLTKPGKTPVAELLDSGNFVLRNADDDNPQNYLWQSFDHPTDTFLPGMKFGINYKTGLDMILRSWQSSDDPAQGDYTYSMDSHGFPQYFIRKDTVKVFRSGPWNGVRFSGMPTISSNPIYNFTFVMNQNETYFNYNLLDSSVVSRMVLNQDGVQRRMTWKEGSSTSWIEHLTTEMTNCDTLAFCGPYGLCTVSNSPECGCLQLFEPKFPKDWGTDWSNGCVRRTPLNCSGVNGDKFWKYSGVKVPDTENSWFSVSMTLKECETMCLKNCSCMAYANLDVRGEGSGCLLWFDELVDIRVIKNGQDLYVRMDASEFGQAGHNWNKAKTIIVILVVSTATLILGLAISLYIWKEWQKREGKTIGHPEQGYYKESKNEDIELPLFHLVTITKATDNFAIDNKLGEGGFGPVYKGMLEGGQEIAVKLLSKDSKQGVDEFKNEVICIAKLQHRNLVKLLGYCIQGEERMLIYEFMPNNNLDSFIFDQSQKMLLDWPKRFHIINGIARGLLYLHQDSRLRIIHRDLKGSNILLDHEMNPKISDFGLARIFEANETQANTRRVVGTYGYMSPEYAVEGLFSVKSDVFSFGVLVLEIVSGNRNRGFYHQDHHLNLLGHAWRLYKEDRTRELIDEPLQDSCNLPEVLRSIQVGLLCVQQRPEDRPNMASVVLMLGGEGALTHPKQPGFFTERNLLEAESTGSNFEQCSANTISTTVVEAR